MIMRRLFKLFCFYLVLAATLAGGVYFLFYKPYVLENKILKDMIVRLEADSRIAEVIVTDSIYDSVSGKTKTTIKFLEYSSDNKPLEPQYFTFSGNLIQFQSLVLRFEDDLVCKGNNFKGRSAYLFWKVFCLNGKDTEEFEITKINAVPDGYKVVAAFSATETGMWEKFWSFAFDSEKRKKEGVKNVQVEAPGVVFVPGFLYTIKIEHDGGIRIDAEALPRILAGEKLL